jgi:hypothetical protein
MSKKSTREARMPGGDRCECCSGEKVRLFHTGRRLVCRACWMELFGTDPEVLWSKAS